MGINFNDPKWYFEERVKRLMAKGNTREEAEQVVKTVITTKEREPAPIVLPAPGVWCEKHQYWTGCDKCPACYQDEWGETSK
jgi:hypothetical protein